MLSGKFTLSEHTAAELTIQPNTLMLDSTSQTNCWTVTATADNVYEDDTEMVTLTLMTMTGGVTLGNPSTTVVNVLDNDGKLEHSYCAFC